MVHVILVVTGILGEGRSNVNPCHFLLFNVPQVIKRLQSSLVVPVVVVQDAGHLNCQFAFEIRRSCFPVFNGRPKLYNFFVVYNWFLIVIVFFNGVFHVYYFPPDN